jgi:hypothetical protein
MGFWPDLTGVLLGENTLMEYGRILAFPPVQTPFSFLIPFIECIFNTNT